MRTMREDIRTVFDKDPAARSVLEVMFCYPGLHALWLHRMANFLWRHHLRLLGRFLSQFSRWKIKRRLFIKSATDATAQY